MEWFPLANTNNNLAKNNNNEQHNNNADLCQTFLQLAATVQQSTAGGGSSHEKLEVQYWMTVVADHIQSCLEQDEENILGHKNNKSFEYATSPSLIRVLEEILMVPFDDRTGDLLSERHDESVLLRSNLVELFCTVFFSPDQVTTAYRSATGRAAAQMACRWFAVCNYNLEQAQQRYGVAVSDLLHGIPHYLVHWRGDYITESTAVMELLQQVVRRLPIDDVSRHEDDNAATVSGGGSVLVVLSQLRTAMEQLLTTATASNGSILEDYPEELQRQVICFVTMLTSPSTLTVHALGEICARRRLVRWENDGAKRKKKILSGTVASFIVQCIHSIRKTIPMQLYIGFLIDSTGILKLGNAPVEKQTCLVDELLNGLDAGVAVVADCLVKCGTRSKILPMFEALLSVLVNDMCDTDVGVANAFGVLVQARAALAIVAMFAIDLSKNNTMNASVFEFLPEGFKPRIHDCITKLIVLCSSDERFSSLQTWLRPLIALFSAEQSLLVQSFGSLLSSQVQGLVKSAQIQLFELWLKIVKHPQLVPVIVRDAVSLLAAANALDKSHKDEPSSRQVTGRIVAALEIFAGPIS